MKIDIEINQILMEYLFNKEGKLKIEIAVPIELKKVNIPKILIIINI